MLFACFVAVYALVVLEAVDVPTTLRRPPLAGGLIGRLCNGHDASLARRDSFPGKM